MIGNWLVWDNHSCFPLETHATDHMQQLERYSASGVDVVSLNIGFGKDPVETHLRVLANFRHWLAQRADRYVIASTVSDIEQARLDGKLAIVFDIEGARGVDDQLSLVSLYYDLGVRWMLIAYNETNQAGSGVHSEDHGLTDFGRELITEMERVGMVVCCSHTGERTTMDVMRHATRPVIISHSNPKAVWDHPRNVSDEVMLACAGTGGVIGLNGLGIFLGDNDISTETFVRHVDYAVSLVGPEHVGLGLDYVVDRAELAEWYSDPKNVFPPGCGYGPDVRFLEPERIPEIALSLSRLGYDDNSIGAVLGGNFLRIARKVWK